ncbi:RNA polymerase sigma factor [bacterium]
MIENEIIKQCQNGDLNAFRELYDMYHQPALRIALYMLGHQQDAEDAVQIVFIKLHRSIRGFRFKAKFSTYLFQIVKRVCIDAIRKRKRTRTLSLDSVNHGHQPDWDQKMVLEAAIKNLPDRMRMCFVLFAIEELKQEEIARIMDMTLGGVKSTLYQARIRLRKTLDEKSEN